jgi:hypothetical protein
MVSPVFFISANKSKAAKKNKKRFQGSWKGVGESRILALAGLFQKNYIKGIIIF